MNEVRAVVVREFGEPDSVAVENVPEPQAAAGEVIIDVAFAALNFPDLLVVRGTYQSLPDLPFVPGKEAAGTVTDVGADVDPSWLGRRVIAMVDHGAFAQRIRVSASVLVAIPDTMSFENAAAFGLVYRTAYFGLVRRARLQAGETVLVTGVGGGAGSAAAALSKALGARVIAVVPDDMRAAVARDQGADEVIVLQRESIRERVRDLTGGRGVDVVYDVVGDAVLGEAIRATAFEGRVVVIGFAGGEPAAIKPGHLLVKNIAVIGSVSGEYRDRMPDVMTAAMDELLTLAAGDHLPIPVDSVFALEDAPEGFARVQKGKVLGKVLLAIGAPA
ncbi:NADPH:quinone oxidoreductase family protein [Rhodococcus sp. NPDC057014]|uniref:NADPH:quinone oxidoreductase family protein n=1 Tax=Rhodococcus sp. NPDC057014 TaxID=3346000 RepID=UPI0036426074